MNDESEVARLRKQIAAEYESAQRGLEGLALGASTHEFLTAKARRIAELELRWGKLEEDKDK